MHEQTGFQRWLQRRGYPWQRVPTRGRDLRERLEQDEALMALFAEYRQGHDQPKQAVHLDRNAD